MSQCFVPNWNLRHQRQEQVEGVERNRSSHVHTHQANHLDPMSNYEVTELTWENGQLAMHALGGLVPTTPTKPQWAQAGETLESIVHQATYHKQNLDLVDYLCNPANIDSVDASSGGKWAENSGEVQTGSGSTKKRSRSESGPYQRDYSIDIPTEHPDPSACASASATFYRKADTTMMTWTSLESPRSLKRKTKTTNEDSACHERQENMDEEQETKTETGRSHSTRRSRAAAVHNQSERRRRDRINQKMKALQKLVPNSSKTDKASMLDEVIEYLKQLQAQVQIMSVRNMPQMMMPIGMQQHLQMSLLARMGMGLGMGMGVLDMNSIARSTPQPIPPLMHPNSLPPASQRFVPPFVMPSMMPTHTTSPANPDPGTNPSIPIHDPYYALMMQSMNIDLYNKMAAFYRQNVDQTAQAMSCPSQSNPVQRD